MAIIDKNGSFQGDVSDTKDKAAERARVLASESRRSPDNPHTTNHSCNAEILNTTAYSWTDGPGFTDSWRYDIPFPTDPDPGFIKPYPPVEIPRFVNLFPAQGEKAAIRVPHISQNLSVAQAKEIYEALKEVFGG